MAKLSLATIAGGYASVDTLNSNFDAIEEALENTLSRDGTSPNAMEDTLDMNSQRLVNLPAPVDASDAARLADVTAAISGLPNASLVPFAPAGGTAATTVQGAIEEVATDSVAKATIDAKGDLLVGTASDTVARKAVGVNGATLTADSSVAEGVSWGGTPEIGQCRFAYVSATSCQLSRHNGRFLFINGRFELIPATGPTLGLSGLAVSTTYYVYAYMSGATLTLEASTTANATDATYGHQIKTGDATRTLVGKARTNASTQWELTATKLHVISYFNRRDVAALNKLTTNRTTTSTSPVELHSEIRIEFIAWPEDVVRMTTQGNVENTVTGARSSTFIAVDDVTASYNAGVGGTSSAATSGHASPFSHVLLQSAFTSNHFATLGVIVTSGTGTWYGSSGLGSHLRLIVKG